jgi:RNA polymerase sigma factor (sigma-70 family)
MAVIMPFPKPEPASPAPTARLALLDDSQLAGLAREGSTAAFSALVERHQAPVRAFLRRVAPAPSMADDLAQETFFKAWRQIGQWQARGTFKGWLYMIATRACEDSRRSHTRGMARDRAWLDHSAGLPDPAPAAEASLDLERAMVSLSPVQRQVVAMCYGAGLSHSEAAEALAMPLGTVKSHAARGRDIMLSILQTDGQNTSHKRTVR